MSKSSYPRRLTRGRRRVVPPRTPQPKDDAPRLEAMTRADLNARATELGVEDAENLPNKDAVITAIRKAGG